MSGPGSVADFPILSPRCDWARIEPPRGSRYSDRWHAFPRVPGRNANGETQLDRAACGAGPATAPSSGILLTPSCAACRRLTFQDGLFTVLRAA